MLAISFIFMSYINGIAAEMIQGHKHLDCLLETFQNPA